MREKDRENREKEAKKRKELREESEYNTWCKREDGKRKKGKIGEGGKREERE